MVYLYGLFPFVTTTEINDIKTGCRFFFVGLFFAIPYYILHTDALRKS